MIYVHVPFCRSFCIYCGFYSELAGEDRRDLFRAYTDAVLDEIRRRGEEMLSSCGPPCGDDAPSRRDALSGPFRSCAGPAAGCPQDRADTLYFGGGTPSLLPASEFTRLVEAVRTVFPKGHRFREFTVEVNPEDLVEKGRDYVEALLSLGVDRFSMGVQSFDDRILRWMNRRHDVAGAEQAFRTLREAGVRNLSLDLIFGVPGMEMRTWQETVGRALALRPEHLSAYQLSVEEDSRLDELRRTGRFKEASDEACRRQYDFLCDRLAEAGYRHYEISNFALPGREAVHNSAYWRRVPYVGLGPGACSLRFDEEDGRRVQRRLSNGRGLPYPVEEERLTEEDIQVETIMLGLRTDTGVSQAYLHAHACRDKVAALLDAGDLEECGDRFRIPESRFFISDRLIGELI